MKRQYRDTGNTGHKTQICAKTQDGNVKQIQYYFIHYIFPVENQFFFLYILYVITRNLI